MEYHLTLTKFEQLFTKRTKDVKKMTWFSFPCDLMTHPDFFHVTGDEFKMFMWVVSIAAKCNSESIRLDIEHACHNLRLDENVFRSMIKKLQGKQIDVGSGHEQATSGQELASTIQYNTLHNSTNTHTSKLDEFPEYVQLWNLHCGELPKVQKVSAPRKRKVLQLQKFLPVEDWIAVVVKVAGNSFLSGKETSWRADFDWVIKEANLTKIVEGNYDRQKPGPKTEQGIHKREQSKKEIMADLGLED